MNKNQKRIRRFAVENKGQTKNVNRAYNLTVDVNNHTTEQSFVARTIPIGQQERSSLKPKVGWHTRPFDHPTRRKSGSWSLA